jgi:hypothetical protein
MTETDDQADLGPLTDPPPTGEMGIKQARALAQKMIDNLKAAGWFETVGGAVVAVNAAMFAAASMGVSLADMTDPDASAKLPSSRLRRSRACAKLVAKVAERLQMAMKAGLAVGLRDE